jgi:hypothetical protein
MRKKISLLIILSIIFCINSYTQNALQLTLNKNVFEKGDTLQISSTFDSISFKNKAISLQVVIEQLETKKQWKFKFPMLRGITNADFIIDSILNEGHYTINTFVQNNYPQLKGVIKNYNSSIKSIGYLMLLKGKPAYIGVIDNLDEAYFSTPKLTFSDTAYFVFYESGKKKNKIDIDLTYEMDSVFKPIAQTRKFITIGHPQTTLDTTDTIHEFIDPLQQTTLQTVMVQSKIKKKIDLFNEAYSTILFNHGDPIIFDGLETDKISRHHDLYTFLFSNMAGISLKQNELGNNIISWRGQQIHFYVDEFKTDNEFVDMINTNDIAMIKVFRPNTGGPNTNGSICIYTKRGPFGNSTQEKFKFLIHGFSPAQQVLQ